LFACFGGKSNFAPIGPKSCQLKVTSWTTRLSSETEKLGGLATQLFDILRYTLNISWIYISRVPVPNQKFRSQRKSQCPKYCGVL